MFASSIFVSAAAKGAYRPSDENACTSECPRIVELDQARSAAHVTNSHSASGKSTRPPAVRHTCRYDMTDGRGVGTSMHHRSGQTCIRRPTDKGICCIYAICDDGANVVGYTVHTPECNRGEYKFRQP